MADRRSALIGHSHTEYSLLAGATFTGDVSVINLTASGTFRSTTTTDASLSSTGHAFQIGLTSAVNLIIDNNEIMTRNNGAVQTISINAQGGDINLGPNTSSSSSVFIRGGTSLVIEDGAGTDDVTFSHDGTDFNAAGTNTTDWNLTGLAALKLGAACTLNLFDSDNSAQVILGHDGTDMTLVGVNTTDIEMSGITGVNIGGDIIRFGGGLKSIIFSETLTLDDDATGTVTVPSSTNAGLVMVLGGSSDNRCCTYLAEWAGTPTITNITLGSAVSLHATTNPDVDGDVNVWNTGGPDTVSVKNRVGSSQTFSVYIFGG